MEEVVTIIFFKYLKYRQNPKKQQQNANTQKISDFRAKLGSCENMKNSVKLSEQLYGIPTKQIGLIADRKNR